MSDLSPEERAFLDIARVQWGPRASAAPPSEAAIGHRLAAKPWLAERVASLPDARRFRRLFGILTIGVCTMSFVVLRDGRSSAPASAADRAALSPIPVMIAPAPQTQLPPEPAPAIAISALPDAPRSNEPRSPRPAQSVLRDGARRAPEPPAAPATRPASPQVDTLAEELALIHAAQRELRRGAPGEALGTLDAHASRFPHGVLRDERLTLGVLAHCARGEVDAARAVKGELERSSPGSSHLQRLASSCAR